MDGSRRPSARHERVHQPVGLCGPAALAAAGALLSGMAALLQIAAGGETQEAETLFLVGSIVLTAWVLILGLRLWRGLPVPAPEPAAGRATVGARP